MANNVEPISKKRAGNYKITRFNALQHGVLSKHTVLPWEDREEYDALLDAVVTEYRPQGPIEEHLVEELAGIIWRKRRLRLGEKAAYTRALKRAATPEEVDETASAALVQVAPRFKGHATSRAVSATDEQSATDGDDLEAMQSGVLEALRLLDEGSPNAVQKAMKLLTKDIRISSTAGCWI